MKPLPKPQHALGYTDREIQAFMTVREYERFRKWMRGQTMTENSDGELISYSWDVDRFLLMVREGVPTYWD